MENIPQFHGNVVPSLPIRFIERNSEKVLQFHMGWFHDWEDVPTVKEQIRIGK